MIDKLIDSLYAKLAIKQCAEELEKNPDIDACETSCGALMINNDEDLQVKIIVTRNADDFIEDFDLIQHRIINKKAN